MFESLEVLESQIKDYLNDFRFYSAQGWVVPRKTGNDEKIYDVAIVGAGQAGLTLAYNLKLRGIRRIAVIDRQPKDKPGPWSTFARMQQLRTPKSIQGMENGNPLLSFKTWFCSKYSEERYEKFQFIPLHHWIEYMAWFRCVLSIDTVNETHVTDLQWDAGNRCLRLATHMGESSRFIYCKKICLATGMDAVGAWDLPDQYSDVLPRNAYSCAWEPIEFQQLEGKRIAVIGSGASGFDNAACAIDAGCQSVTLISRSLLPEKDIYFELWRGRNDADVFADEASDQPADYLNPLLEHNASLDDSERIELLRALFKYGRSPSNPEYLSRARHLDKIRILEGAPIRRISFETQEKSVQIDCGGEVNTFDHVIFAVGVKVGIEKRPELRSISNSILTWGDVVQEDLPLSLRQYPKLSKNFQFVSKYKEANFLKDIYSLSDIVHLTVGLQTLALVTSDVARHVSAALYEEQHLDNLRFIGSAYNTVGLT